MSVFGRYRWFAAAVGITLAFVGVSLLAHRGPWLTSFSDVFGFAMGLILVIATLVNVIARPVTERWFWALMAFGFCLWDFNQATWAYREVLLHVGVPDPYFSDIVLFFHLVPMIAAVVWRPDLVRKPSPFHLSTLHFLMLLVWWIFLYAFIVFPHQYVIVDAAAYDHCYLLLYQVENLLLVLVLGFAAWASSAGWRRLYLNLLAAEAVYTLGSQVLDEAVSRGSYYSGSVYDIPMAIAILWIGATVLSARNWDLAPSEADTKWKWGSVTPRLAMLAMLSLPLLGMWTFLLDQSPMSSRIFRLFTVLAAMLALGSFVFLRQYVQDQTLMRLLQESRSGFENQQRLQNHLVQRDKLASLGQLVAGAAHDIHHPLGLIMDYSERLWSAQHLTNEQDALLRKMVNQARRTRDLVTDLLSFAQSSPGEKAAVELSVLLQRAAQMLEAQHHAGRVHVEISLDSNFPRAQGNANQLFQVFVEIIENAMDAMAETGGGSLGITGSRQGRDLMLQFADSGPGIREPQRVFDPFYTTKPVGKGTGLGLSAVYGVIQDHGGQISCQNRPEGGAIFVLHLPAAEEVARKAAEAAKA